MDFFYSIVAFFATGGLFMYPILLVFAFGVAIAVERFVTLTMITSKNQVVWDKVQPLLDNGEFNEARAMTGKDESTISQVLNMGLSMQGAVRRREDIEIMRLVGASNWLGRVPFLLEGALEGFVGAGLAVGFIVVAQQLAVDRLTDLPDWINVAVQSEYLFTQGVLVLLFGVLAGLIGSGLSLTVHKYLRT